MCRRPFLLFIVSFHSIYHTFLSMYISQSIFFLALRFLLSCKKHVLFQRASFTVINIILSICILFLSVNHFTCLKPFFYVICIDNHYILFYDFNSSVIITELYLNLNECHFRHGVVNS